MPPRSLARQKRQANLAKLETGDAYIRAAYSRSNGSRTFFTLGGAQVTRGFKASQVCPAVVPYPENSPMGAAIALVASATNHNVPASEIAKDLGAGVRAGGNLMDVADVLADAASKRQWRSSAAHEADKLASQRRSADKQRLRRSPRRKSSCAEFEELGEVKALEAKGAGRLRSGLRRRFA